MAGRRSRRSGGGGEDIQAARPNGTRLVTGLGAIACLTTVAAVPVARADVDLQGVVARAGILGVVVLLAAVVRSWPSLVPVALVLAAGGYAAELAIDDAPLDSSAPVLAAALLVAGELAYWSIEETERIAAEPGSGLRHAVLVAILGLGALIVGAALLALVDAVHVRSLGLDVAGAAAAAALAIVLVARRRDTE